jgi:hypothetical protein
MNYIISITILSVSVYCLGNIKFLSNKSSRERGPIFDQIKGLSNKCKAVTRSPSIECEFNACGDVGCPNCECQTNPSDEDMCYII